MPRLVYSIFSCVFITLVSSWGNAEELRILAWNVESNRPQQPPVSDPETIGAQLAELLSHPDTRASLIALSEVEPKTFERYRQSVADSLHVAVDYVTSASGGFRDADSLMLIADKNRFEIREAIELHRYAGILANFNIADPNDEEFGALRARSPLAVKLWDRSNSLEFWVVVNHLARGEADLRTQQAQMLRKWAQDRQEPIIAIGDFNFDYDFHTSQGNAGFRAMMEGDVWKWLKPEPLIDTNWSDNRAITDRRVDRYPDSMLDFAFAANAAKSWACVSKVILRPDDFPDTDRTSDHRPIFVQLSP